MAPSALNPHAAVWLPLTAPADDQAARPALCDLPLDVLQCVLRFLTAAEDLGRAACVCKLLRTAAAASLGLRLSFLLPLAPDAPQPALPSSVLGSAVWLGGVTSVHLSGAFLLETEAVICLQRAPNLVHLSLLGCQKVLGDATVAAVLDAAAERRLRCFSVQHCFAFAAAAGSALLRSCFAGTCPLRTLVLSDIALDVEAATADATAETPCALRSLALVSCELSGDLTSLLAAAPSLAALFLGGSRDAEGNLVGADLAAACASSSLRVLERTRTLGDEPPPFALCSAPGVPAEWDLRCAEHAVSLAAAGTRRLAARLAADADEDDAAGLAATLSAACNGTWVGARRRGPLHAAAFTGDAAHVASLCALGARADARDAGGATPLFIAAEAGHAAACAALLAAGASLELRTAAGEGPPYIAALKGRMQAAEVLLAAASARDLPPESLATHDGWLPCHAAAVAGRPRMLALCASHCLSGLDAPNRFGQTAMHIVARKGSDELADILLAAGAAVGVRDGRGAAPADVAAKHGHAALASKLRALEPKTKRSKRRQAAVAPS